MPTYTIVVTGLDGHQHVTPVEFRDDGTIIADTRQALTEEHRSIAVARGCGDEVEFLGAWDRDESGEARWTPEE